MKAAKIPFVVSFIEILLSLADNYRTTNLVAVVANLLSKHNY